MNRGYKCHSCGWIGKKPSSQTIKKVKYDICPNCANIANEWERPLNKRDGRCRNCAHGSFTQAMYKGDLIIKCKKCEMVTNPDTGAILREGNKAYEFKTIV